MDENLIQQIDTEERQKEDKLRRAISDNQFDFQSWMELVKHIESYVIYTQKNAQMNIAVYRQILQEYPLCYGYWRKLADIYAVQGQDNFVEAVYEEALDFLSKSPEIWTAYCAWKMNKKPQQEARDLFERAAQHCGQVYQGTQFWEKYIEFERNNKEYERIGQIYWTLLNFPTSKLHDYYKRFRSFIEARGRKMEHYGATVPQRPTGDEISGDDPHYASKIEMMYSIRCEESKQKRVREIQERYEQTVVEYNKRRGFEQGIKRHFFHSKQLDESQLQNWRQYIEFEERQGDNNRIILLYERCLIPCCFYSEFWTRYALYLNRQQGYDQAMKIFERANTKFLSKRHWGFIAQGEFEELVGNFDQAKELYQKVYSEIAPNLFEAIFKHLSIERRQKNYEVVQQLYQRAFDFAYDQNQKHLISFVSYHYSKFQAFTLGDLDQALETLQNSLTNIKDQKSLYLAYLSLCQKIKDFPRRKQLTKDAFEQSIANLHGSNREDMWKNYISWMRDSWDNVLEIEQLEQRYQRVFPQKAPYH